MEHCKKTSCFDGVLLSNFSHSGLHTALLDIQIFQLKLCFGPTQSQRSHFLKKYVELKGRVYPGVGLICDVLTCNLDICPQFCKGPRPCHVQEILQRSAFERGAKMYRRN